MKNCWHLGSGANRLTTSDHHDKIYLFPFFQWSVQSLLAGNISSINQQSHHILLPVCRQYLPGKIQPITLLQDIQQLSSGIRRIAQLQRHSQAELFAECTNTSYRNQHDIDPHSNIYTTVFILFTERAPFWQNSIHLGLPLQTSHFRARWASASRKMA